MSAKLECFLVALVFFDPFGHGFPWFVTPGSRLLDVLILQEPPGIQRNGTSVSTGRNHRARFRA